MENKIPTAEEFYQRAMDDKTIGDDITDLMNAYAKMHVTAALKAALEDAPYGSSTDTVSYKDMKDSILNAYPLTNIK